MLVSSKNAGRLGHSCALIGWSQIEADGGLAKPPVVPSTETRLRERCLGEADFLKQIRRPRVDAVASFRADDEPHRQVIALGFGEAAREPKSTFLFSPKLSKKVPRRPARPWPRKTTSSQMFNAPAAGFCFGATALRDRHCETRTQAALIQCNVLLSHVVQRVPSGLQLASSPIAAPERVGRRVLATVSRSRACPEMKNGLFQPVQGRDLGDLGSQRCWRLALAQ